MIAPQVPPGTTQPRAGLRRDVNDDDGTQNSDSQFIDRTIAVWQPRAPRPLTREDARQIAENVVGVFGVLDEWARADNSQETTNDGRR